MVGGWSVGAAVGYFVPFTGTTRTRGAIRDLRDSGLVGGVCLLAARAAAAPLPNYSVLAISTLGSDTAVHTITARSSTSCALLCAGCAALSPNVFTFRHVVRVTRSDGTNVICTSRCRITRNIRGGTPIVSCRPKDLHSSFGFNSILLCGTDTLGRTIDHVGTSCRFTKLCSLHLGLSRGRTLIRVGRCLCSRIRGSAHGDNRGVFSCMSPGGQKLRVRVRRTYARRLGRVNNCLTPRFGGVRFDTNGFRCRTSIVVPMHGHVHAVESTVQSMLGRGASFGFGLVVVSGRSASKAASTVHRFASSRHLVRVIPRQGSLNVNNY